jgi:hypothetical protein
LTVQEVTRSTSREISRPPASFVDHDRRLQAAMTLANALRQSNPDRAIQEATDLRNASEGELLGLLEGPSPENQKNETENSIENSAAAQPTR